MAKNRLVARVLAAPLARTHDWLGLLGAQDRKDLLELRRDFLAGKFNGRAPTTIYKIVRKEIGLTVGRDRFIAWLQETNNGAAQR